MWSLSLKHIRWKGGMNYVILLFDFWIRNDTVIWTSYFYLILFCWVCLYFRTASLKYSEWPSSFSIKSVGEKNWPHQNDLLLCDYLFLYLYRRCFIMYWYIWTPEFLDLAEAPNKYLTNIHGFFPWTLLIQTKSELKRGQAIIKLGVNKQFYKDANIFFNIINLIFLHSNFGMISISASPPLKPLHCIKIKRQVMTDFIQRLFSTHHCLSCLPL